MMTGLRTERNGFAFVCADSRSCDFVSMVSARAFVDERTGYGVEGVHRGGEAEVGELS